MAKMNKVATNLQQDFTDVEKAQARQNIGALGSSDVLTANRYNWSSPSTPISVDEIKFNQKGVNTAQIVADTTNLGSTVPLPSRDSEEGKVPMAYYRDGRGYYLLEKYKDERLPDSNSTDVGKALVVDSHGTPVWDTISGDSFDTIQQLLAYNASNTTILDRVYIDGNDNYKEYVGNIGFTTTSSGNMSVCVFDANERLIYSNQCVNFTGQPTGTTNFIPFTFKETGTERISFIGIKGSANGNALLTHLFYIGKKK